MKQVIKAISLWQPWATLIAIEAKTYETRSWAPNYTGPLVIHAARRWTDEERAYCRIPPFRQVLEAAGITDPDSLPRGKAICVVDLVGCYTTEDIWRDLSEQERAFGNCRPGRFAWKLANARPFRTPITIQGMQGLWTWPANIPLPESRP